MVREILPELGKNGSLARSYFADPFYRSLYELNLDQWLRSFDPRQFAVIPMRRYLKKAKARRATIRELEKHFGLGLTASVITDAPWLNRRHYGSLEEELDESAIEWLQNAWFRP